MTVSHPNGVGAAGQRCKYERSSCAKNRADLRYTLTHSESNDSSSSLAAAEEGGEGQPCIAFFLLLH